MKLSEAIRLGAMLGPQGFGGIDDRSGDGTLCALQAAQKAIGLEYDCYDMEEHFPILLLRVWVRGGNTSIGSAIINLNDKHRWTRERIANWVETFERDLEAKAQAAKPEEVTA